MLDKVHIFRTSRAKATWYLLRLFLQLTDIAMEIFRIYSQSLPESSYTTFHTFSVHKPSHDVVHVHPEICVKEEHTSEKRAEFLFIPLSDVQSF